VRNRRRRFWLRRRGWVPHARRQHPTAPRERRRSPTRPRSSSDGSNGEQTRKRDAGPSKIVDAKPRRRRSNKQPARRCRPRRPHVNAANAISCVSPRSSRTRRTPPSSARSAAPLGRPSREASPQRVGRSAGRRPERHRGCSTRSKRPFQMRNVRKALRAAPHVSWPRRSRDTTARDPSKTTPGTALRRHQTRRRSAPSWRFRVGDVATTRGYKRSWLRRRPRQRRSRTGPTSRAAPENT